MGFIRYCFMLFFKSDEVRKDIDYDTFSTKVNSKKNPNVKFEKEQVCEKLLHYANVMPTYFLVEEEIEAIYYYIKNLE